ncbi:MULTISPECIES: lasso peptide biosynthesis PqqD family chaperone [unclassified Paenibacillus]|uniref:lasso peptide biosynthesis PqqD family chaperone n=1 Tax=unclassified Paenibacillus TaxID=185978 RepID=UPI00070910D6|nr:MULTISPECIES: lasso peptide biosynthesis PqqD family chaperone [unclassified Paenibacillus]KQX52086.1 metallophosphoesterase [Paenibacillus sp. Root444D2]KRE51114.1 metallophosphoesterase [Paenibacillus sp. Soil724D2]
MKYTIPLNVQIVQGEGNIVSDMDGEKVMLNIANGKYYNLGQIGGHIWELISAPISVEELVTALTKEFDVEQEVCEEQTKVFLNHLLEEKIIHVC